MTRLPTPGGDINQWGNILNDFLNAAHNSDGSLRTNALQQAGGTTSVNSKTPLNGNISLAAADLSDVSISTAAANQVLVYNSGTSKWANQTFIDTTATDLQPIGVATAGSSGKAADVGHIHPHQPWQFHVKKYGAKGDGKVVADANTSSGSSTLTSASANFLAGDAGKAIMVQGAGSGGDALITTIASVTNSTTVVLALAAGSTVTNAPALYGTDDTAAVQAAMAALSSSPYLTSVPFYAELLFDPAIYCLAGPPVKGGTTRGNAQIPLPVPDVTDKNVKPTVVIKGTSDNSTLAFWEQSMPQLAGTCLVSMLNVTSNDPTWGPMSVIGGPTVNTDFPSSGHFNNILAVIDGISVVCPENPGQIAYDFYWLCQFAIHTASALVFWAPNGLGNVPTLTNAMGLGLRVPLTGSNDRCDIFSLSIEGYYYGMTFDQHVAASRVAIIYSNTGLYTSLPGGGVMSHACNFGYLSVEIAQTVIYVSAGSNPALFGINVGMLDTEGTNGTLVYDPNNALVGHINVFYNGSAPIENPTVNGASNLEIISMANTTAGTTTRGHVTAPAVPASGIALQNPYWRHAAVNITGGTVSNVAVDGAATGFTATNCTVMVPSGKTITLTYSVAPSWNWTLL